MSVAPWKKGWLEYNTPNGWTRWWSSLSTTPESIRILGGMTVVTYNQSSISPGYVILPNAYPQPSSGYRHGSDNLLSVFWPVVGEYRKTWLSKSVTRSLASLDDIAVDRSPTLAALRLMCRELIGEDE
jgi:hypothetical protein